MSDPAVQILQGDTIHRAGREKGAPAQPVMETVTTGWKPTCACWPETTRPCTVLDPFGGAGTTAVVAHQHNRSCILIELNPEYCEMATKRLETVQPRLL